MSQAQSAWQSSFPLFVHIQSIDSTDLRSHAPETPKHSSHSIHVTCLEGSNRFVFVGFSNGAIDVYFRNHVRFITTVTIPSVEAKICNLLCSEHENYLAVGSVQGKLAVLKCNHEKLKGNLNENMEHGDPLFLLYSVSHHLGNVVTALFWSTNERNLFIGDSCGLVSQLTVELLEHFPRPLPTKSVLEATSRITDLDYMFPYLAIGTTNSVHLCDVESAEYVRVQLRRLRDIKATGLCFQLTVAQNAVQLAAGSLQLLISEEGSGLLHIANMEGIIVSSIQVSTLSHTTRCAAKLFDPLCTNSSQPSPVQSNLKSEVGVRVETKLRQTPSMVALERVMLGSLLVMDTNFIVSYTHENVFVIDQSQMQIVSWTPFSKIQRVKLVSNYVFIWHGKTLTLISLTPFRHYGEQLLQTGLVLVLEQWIEHAISSVGWMNPDVDLGRESEADVESSHIEIQNQISSEIFQQMVGYPINEQDEFCAFVYKHVPDNLVNIPPEFAHLKIPPPENPFAVFLRQKLIPTLESVVAEDPSSEKENMSLEHCSFVLNCIGEFYSEQSVVPSCDQQAETLVTVLQCSQQFLTAVKVTIDSKRSTVQLLQRCKLLIHNFVQQLLQMQTQVSTESLGMCTQWAKFQNYISCPSRLEWFEKIGVPTQEIVLDAIRADLIVFLAPFSNAHTLIPSLSGKIHLFTWLTFELLQNSPLNNPPNCPFVNLIKGLVGKSNPLNPTTRFSSQLVSLIYKELVSSDVSRMSPIFHHLASVLHLVSQEYEDGNMTRTLRMVLATFPLQHWSKNEIRRRVAELCEQNKLLLPILVQASLQDASSQDLCLCSLPIRWGGSDHSFPAPSAQQQEVDECLLQLLLDRRDMAVAVEKSSAFQFAMKKSLAHRLVTFMATRQQRLSADVISQLILRSSSSCSILQLVHFDSKLLKILVAALKGVGDSVSNVSASASSCGGCGHKLVTVGHHKQIDFDCIGVWVLAENGLNQCIHILKEFGLNVAGTFGTRFYRGIEDTLKSRRNRRTNGNACSKHNK